MRGLFASNRARFDEVERRRLEQLYDAFMRKLFIRDINYVISYKI